MDNAIVELLPQLGLSLLFLYATVKLFTFLMDSNNAFRRYLIDRNKYLEDENKDMRQALFMSSNPDVMRLATTLLKRPSPPITEIVE